MAMKAVARDGVSIALACRAFEIGETCYRYSPALSDENKEITDWLERLTTNKRTWGFGLCFLYLRNVQGYERGNIRRPGRCTAQAGLVALRLQHGQAALIAGEPDATASAPSA
jgi:putative transposase